MDDFDKQGWMGRHMSAATHCQVIRQGLSEYLDGVLPPEQRAGCEAHLAGCRACRAELNGLKTMLESLRTLPEPRTPDLVPGVHRKLAARAAGRQSAPALTVDWRAWRARLAQMLSSQSLRPIALGAVAVLVVVVVALIPRPVGQKTDLIISMRLPQAEPPVPASSAVDGLTGTKLASAPELADAKTGKVKKEMAADEMQAPIREYNRRAKPVEEAVRANAARDDATGNELKRQLADNKAASMEQAIEGALSARGRVGSRRFEAEREKAADKADERYASAPAVGGAAQLSAPAQQEWPGLPSPPAAAKDGEEPPVNRYQWDVPEFTQAAMLMQQWVQARQGLVVPIDQRTFVVTIPPGTVVEFTRLFSSRIVSSAPVSLGKSGESDEADVEPFVTIWIELIRSK